MDPYNFDIESMVRCTECPEHFQHSKDSIKNYLLGKSVACPSCGKNLDWWNVVLREVHDNFMLNRAFMQIGARTKYFTVSLKPNTRTRYKLSDHGIPEEARVLYVNYSPYTPGGNGFFPTEMTGNIPTRRYPRNEVVLWPVPIGDGSAESTEVGVMVTWVEHSDLDESWNNLVNAFEQYSLGQYENCIVPGAVAVESTCSIFLTGYLEKLVSKKQVESFLEDGATYSHQLNVVVPLIAKLKDLPLLPDHIRGSLNRLRKLRNEMAHNGTLETPLTKMEAAKVLCAALFGFKYIQFLQSLLREN